MVLVLLLGFELVLPFFLEGGELFLHLSDLGLMYLGGKVSFGSQFVQLEDRGVDLRNLLTDLHRSFVISLILLCGIFEFGDDLTEDILLSES